MNKRIFFIYKDGLIIGALVGLIAAYFTIKGGADFDSIVNSSKGLIDVVFDRNTALELAQTKTYIVFSLIGAMVGFAFDYFYGRIRGMKKN